mmetsp:Transcript_14732/g.27985  ORF Transcript_14732/g.27985 Transcript_14732/m.27985 type:complete len:241 (+) Transcript_14732:258-980(+)
MRRRKVELFVHAARHVVVVVAVHPIVHHHGNLHVCVVGLDSIHVVYSVHPVSVVVVAVVHEPIVVLICHKVHHHVVVAYSIHHHCHRSVHGGGRVSIRTAMIYVDVVSSSSSFNTKIHFSHSIRLHKVHSVVGTIQRSHIHIHIHAIRTVTCVRNNVAVVVVQWLLKIAAPVVVVVVHDDVCHLLLHVDEMLGAIVVVLVTGCRRYRRHRCCHLRRFALFLVRGGGSLRFLLSPCCLRGG